MTKIEATKRWALFSGIRGRAAALVIAIGGSRRLTSRAYLLTIRATRVGRYGPDNEKQEF